MSRSINVHVSLPSTFFTNFQHSRRGRISTMLLYGKAVTFWMIFVEGIKGGRTISTTYLALPTRVLGAVLRSKIRMTRRCRQSTSVYTSLLRLTRRLTRHRTIIRNLYNYILGSEAINRQITRQSASFGRLCSFPLWNTSSFNNAFRNQNAYARVGKGRIIFVYLRWLIGTVRVAGFF